MSGIVIDVDIGALIETMMEWLRSWRCKIVMDIGEAMIIRIRPEDRSM
jgi:hypothetical protein